jgi:hypothetical protein
MRGSRGSCRSLGCGVCFIIGGLLPFLPLPALAVPEEIPAAQLETEAAHAKQLAEACARSICRTESRELRLKSTAGGEWGIKTQLFPYADNGQIVLYPGETIEVEFAADGKAMDKPHFVRVVEPGAPQNSSGNTNTPAPNTAIMTLEFKQVDGKPDMLLTIKSTLGFLIKYDAQMFVPTKNGTQSIYTSSCPIVAKGSAFETWPHEIAMIVLHDFRVVSERDGVACN